MDHAGVGNVFLGNPVNSVYFKLCLVLLIDALVSESAFRRIFLGKEGVGVEGLEPEDILVGANLRGK